MPLISVESCWPLAIPLARNHHWPQHVLPAWNAIFPNRIKAFGLNIGENIALIGLLSQIAHIMRKIVMPTHWPSLQAD
jgi:hypothetical protein